MATNQEILEKAIQKAIDGGWIYIGDRFMGTQNILDEIADTNNHNLVQNAEYTVIFNHDFAKALWGEGKPRFETGWKGHLKNMVVSEDPIKYLGENI